MIRRLALIVFDCDGVLVDSERLAVRIDVKVITALGWAMTEADIIDRFVGRSEESIAKDIEAHLGRPLPPNWTADNEHLYRAAFAAELKPVPGAVEALDQITIPTCVASSGSHDKIRYTLGITGLYERFAGRIFSADDVARGKPAPDLFLHAAERMGVEPAACAVVEDSRYGIEAARAAGMLAFGFTGGLTPAERLRGPETILFNSMLDLPRLVAHAADASHEPHRSNSPSGGDTRRHASKADYPRMSFLLAAGAAGGNCGCEPGQILC
jgi:HAD superfamily hydrolase (TIGR01509 family)